MPENPVRFKQKSAALTLVLCLGVLAVSLLLSLLIAAMFERGGWAQDRTYSQEEPSSHTHRP